MEHLCRSYGDGKRKVGANVDKFWKCTMNTFLNILYHNSSPYEKKWYKEYKHEVSNMVDDIKKFYEANQVAGVRIARREMTRFLIYTEHVHIGQEKLVTKEEPELWLLGNVSDWILTQLWKEFNEVK